MSSPLKPPAGPPSHDWKAPLVEQLGRNQRLAEQLAADVAATELLARIAIQNCEVHRAVLDALADARRLALMLTGLRVRLAEPAVAAAPSPEAVVVGAVSRAVDAALTLLPTVRDEMDREFLDAVQGAREALLTVQGWLRQIGSLAALSDHVERISEELQNALLCLPQPSDDLADDVWTALKGARAAIVAAELALKPKPTREQFIAALTCCGTCGQRLVADHLNQVDRCTGCGLPEAECTCAALAKGAAGDAGAHHGDGPKAAPRKASPPPATPPLASKPLAHVVGAARVTTAEGRAAAADVDWQHVSLLAGVAHG